jgi:hypothetical protein
MVYRSGTNELYHSKDLDFRVRRDRNAQLLAIFAGSRNETNNAANAAMKHFDFNTQKEAFEFVRSDARLETNRNNLNFLNQVKRRLTWILPLSALRRLLTYKKKTRLSSKSLFSRLDRFRQDRWPGYDVAIYQLI